MSILTLTPGQSFLKRDAGHISIASKLQSVLEALLNRHFSSRVSQSRKRTSEKTETLTSLHKAAANGDADACKGLLQSDRECLFVQNEEGLFPIHCAAEAGN